MTDTFSTVSGPFIKIENPHPAVEQLLGPLFSKVLIFAGPGAHISSLRNYQCFRDKMARLSADTLRTIGLPAVPPPTDIDMMALRQFLTEPTYSYFGMKDGWRLSELAVRTLIASPLTSRRALESMLHPRAPEFVLEAISLRSSTPSDLLDRLVDAVLRGNHNPGVVFNLARHPNASANALASARGLLATTTPSASLTRATIVTFERAIARSDNTDKRDLAMLSRHDHVLVRGAVASNRNTDVADLVTLSSDTEASVRRNAADNPNLPRETLIAMSMDGKDSVRAAVAGNLSIDEEFVALLVSLCTDRKNAADMRVLLALAENPNVSVDDCFDLEKTSHRAILAKYSETPQKLRTLAGMKDDHLLRSVARNTSAPADVLSSLAGSTNAKVREEVAKNSATPPEILEQLSSDAYGAVRRRVAGNPHVPTAVLETLASDESCKAYVACNINTPPHVLETLSTDEDHEVRCVVAENKSTPGHVLEAELESNEDDENIMICLLSNPNLSLGCVSTAIVNELRRADEGERSVLRNGLLTRYDEINWWSGLPKSTLVALSQSSNVNVRREMAKNPLLSTARLVTMSHDADDEVVEILASNPTVQMAVDKLSCNLAWSGVARNKRPIVEISGS